MRGRFEIDVRRYRFCMRKVLLLLIMLAAGCRQVPMLPGISPHRIDIQQGNYVTQDMVAKLKPGMTKSQVRFALGTPLIVDPFHSDRWDYIYVLQKRGRVVEQRRIVVLFQGDKLTRIDGDIVPSAAAAAQERAAEPAKPMPQQTDSAKSMTEGSGIAKPAPTQIDAANPSSPQVDATKSSPSQIDATKPAPSSEPEKPLSEPIDAAKPSPEQTREQTTNP